ncbi:hypothetical protein ISU07_14830 [Nocardioides islandensis]|uniref:Uncharacterized protein n=1 Tax=Nocardioides islandensis TaxID=433663 RepID=A0A930VH06_9ACTN|nr:hypothetical protein [Nocardioides islandensis]MBF4764406.1 hypothetical protein [Nocardioides islandensis]
MRAQRIPSPSPTSRTGEPTLGVTRIDLVCGPAIELSAEALTRRWAQDRALRGPIVERLATLALTATEHGLRFGPRGLTLLIRWLDLDRIRLEVRWHGCSSSDPPCSRDPSLARGEIERAAAILDELADDWGISSDAPAPVHWMVLDTR